MAKKTSSASMWLILAAFIVVILLIALSIGKRGGGQYDAFAQCLTDQGVKSYSAYWCPNCANQKDLFGASWDLIDDKECAVRGHASNLTLCQTDGITGVPTWEFGDGQRVSGTQPLRALSERTGCQLDGTFVGEGDTDAVSEGASSVVEDSADSEDMVVDIETESGITIEGVTATPVRE